MITWTSEDGGLSLSVKGDRIVFDRPQYTYEIHALGEMLHRGDDLKGGSGAPFNELEMMKTLASFIGAWLESGVRGENHYLFPNVLDNGTNLREIIGNYDHEILMMGMEES